MKRETLRLKDLNKGDVFYYFDDSKRQMHRCLGEGEPIEKYMHSVKTMRVQLASDKNPKLYTNVSVDLLVVKVQL